MLKKAVQCIIEDESFHIPVEPAATALRTAKTVLEWARDHNDGLLSCELQICSTLRPCLKGAQTSYKKRREAMWRNYHKVRSMEQFRHLWTVFLAEVGVEVSPVPAFYQVATDHIFEQMVVAATPVEDSQLPPVQPLSYEDANVIRFAAGYVCRKVHERLNKSRQANKEELLSCIMDLVESDREVQPSPSADWVQAVDRGGLWHVKQGTYMLFYAMEEEVRHHFRMATASRMNDGSREKIVASIISNDDVSFHWCMLSPEASKSDANTVLKLLVQLWTTIRGFSFASAWLEVYKQKNKENLQRSKALRKKIK